MNPQELSFEDALRIVRGCVDYGGGHHSDGHMEAFQHGIKTCINALEAAKERGLKDGQIAVLHNIGSRNQVANKEKGEA